MKARQSQEKRYRLAVLTSHPIQYQTPLWRTLAQHPQIDLTVYFCSDYGVTEKMSPDFGVKFKWDIPLLEGYRYRFLKNYAFSSSPSRFWGLINPGIVVELWRKQYDAILIHGYALAINWLSFFAAWLFATPIMFRGEIDLSTPRPFLRRFAKKAILVSLFRRIDAFLYSYKANAEYYKHYKVPDDKLFFCPCAVDNSFWQIRANESKNRRDQLRRDLGIPNRYPVILYSGKLIPRKRPMDLLKAYELLCNQIKASLIFVGDGPEADNLRDYIHKKNLKEVYFAGFKNQSELPVFYSIADLCVLPSNHDPSPKTLNEAMNFGLPIITTNKVGTAPDIIKNGENGFIYPVGDIDALCECLSKLLSDVGLIKRMGEKSLEIVSKWSFEEDLNGILKALEYVTRFRKHNG